MRQLVLPHGDARGLVEDDVGGLQKRVAQEPVGLQVLAQFVDLPLVGGHALKPRQRGDHAQQHRELGVLRNVALAEDDAALGVDPTGHPVGHHLEAGVVDALDVLVPGGERVQIDHRVDALVVVLQAHPVAQGSEEVADVQLACGAHSREHAGAVGGGSGHGAGV